jgi:TolA-binding protein
MKGKSTCRELVDAITRDDRDDGAKAERIERHTPHCEACAARAHTRATVRDAVLAENDRLDDLTRTRVWARLTDTIDAVAARRASKGGRWVRLAWPLGLAAAAVALLVVLHQSQWSRTTPVKEVATLPADRVLTPYLVKTADEAERTELGKALDRLELPARTTVRAHLAQLAELMLVGPLDLKVASAKQGLVEVELARGTLVGDYDGARGGKLRVRSGEVTVEIVGTLFAVEANAGTTRVSVAHGKVRVERPGEVVVLVGGQSWSTSSKNVEPLARPASLLFEQAARGRVDQANAADPRGPALAEVQARLGAEAPLREATASRVRRPLAANLDRRAPEEQPDLASSAPEPQASSWTTPPAAPAVPSVPPAAPRAELAPAPISPPAAPVTASSLYRQAEAALQRGEVARGQQLLSDLVLRFPDDPTADAARFELALNYQKAGKRDQALALADELVRGGREGPFVEPARFLRCRLDVERAEKASACLQRFAEDYPRSPHHAQALQMLIEIEVTAGHCAQAADLAKRYLALHPHGAFAAQAEKVRSDCGK